MKRRDRAAALVVVYVVVVCTFFGAVVAGLSAKELAMLGPVFNSEEIGVSKFAVQDEKYPPVLKVLKLGLSERVGYGAVCGGIREQNPTGNTRNLSSSIKFRLFAILYYFYEKVGIERLSGSLPGIEGMSKKGERGRGELDWLNEKPYPWSLVSFESSVLQGSDPTQSKSEYAVDRDENDIYKSHLLYRKVISPKFLLGLLCICLVPMCVHRSLRSRGSFGWVVLAFLSAHVGAYLLGFYALLGL
ncbi:MAG TPA: hypothetical protein VOA64_16145 [Candidatus Dormibacteraeota bacterium]|nr:hypothetical protein [Candidatus Dormibacteraeota bacterium]